MYPPRDINQAPDPAGMMEMGIPNPDTMNPGLMPPAPIPAPKTFEKTSLHEVLEDIAKEYLKHEQFVRERIVSEARRNNLYDEGIQNIFLSSLSGTAGSWSTFNEYIATLDNVDDIDESDIDIKYINIYKAYKDSLTAALSARVPATRFLPDDAENIEDIYTAEAFEKLALLSRRYNKSKMLLIQIISILINEGVAAVHNYCDRDGKYGYTDKDVIGTVSRGISTDNCPDCGAELSTEELPAQYIEPGGLGPQDNTEFPPTTAYCPQCQNEVNPIRDSSFTQSQEPIDTEQIPKVRTIQKAYGVTNVRFPAYAMDQGDIPYLMLEYECSIAQAEANWKHLKGKIKESGLSGELNDDKWARVNSFYSGDTPKYTCTVQEFWFRDWAFNLLNSETFKHVEVGDERYAGMNPETGEDFKTSEMLQQEYPNGIRLVLVNGEYAEHHEENLDEHWTISFNPLYRYLICKSIGSSIIPIQDLTNDNIALTEQTIEHSVTETFVDSQALDLEKYSKSEIKPGSIVPVVTEPGQALASKFFQTKGASLSQEVGIFANRLESLGEFVSGAMPGVYGGDLPGSSTAAQYSMSRAQSLQRLTIPWDVICNLWSDMELKSLEDFAKVLDYDERYSVKAGSGYKNIYIKQVHLKGKVACVEPESEGYFPITYAQERDLLKELIQINNPDINMVLMHPENRTVIGTYIGPSNLYIPGEEDRKKQLAEIAELIKAVPQPNPNANPMNPTAPPMLPSIVPEPLVDDDMVHLEVVKRWAISVEGQSYKRDFPQQYQNVLAHGQMHKMNMDMKAAGMDPTSGMPLPQNPAMQGNNPNPNNPNVEAPAPPKPNKPPIQRVK